MSKFKTFRISAKVGAVERAVGWLSLQQDGSISVGLNDRTFISPHFKSRQLVSNLYNRIRTTYLVPNSPQALIPISNPHLTFHPPHYFHLHANKDEELFTGIAEVSMFLTQQERVPWVRFVSGPVRTLMQAGAVRDPANTTILKVSVLSDGCSIGIGIDFVRPGDNRKHGGLLDEFLDWESHRIHLFLESLPLQISTLAWCHES